MSEISAEDNWIIFFLIFNIKIMIFLYVYATTIFCTNYILSIKLYLY